MAAPEPGAESVQVATVGWRGGGHSIALELSGGTFDCGTVLSNRCGPGSFPFRKGRGAWVIARVAVGP